jgi:microcystin-dependent protein
MSTPFIGELKLVSFNFAPKGWVTCNGQLLAINENQALFSLLGTFYGGNGVQTFALPNLQGRTPTSMGNTFTIGQITGEESHTLVAAETPTHTHLVNVIPISSSPATGAPGGNLLGSATAAFYAGGAATGTLNTQTVTSFGGNQPHENRQPYLVLNWIIALSGIFPTRN